MKRSWIGLGLLLALLGVSLLSASVMERMHQPIALELEQAGRYALEGDWTHADAQSRLALDDWDRWARFRGCLADHGPIEEIETGMASLRVYRQVKDSDAFAAGCMELARQVEAMGQAHGLVWWNLF